MKRLLPFLLVLYVMISASWAGDRARDDFMIYYGMRVGTEAAMHTYNSINSLKESLNNINKQPITSAMQQVIDLPGPTLSPSIYQQINLNLLNQTLDISSYQQTNFNLEQQPLCLIDTFDDKLQGKPIEVYECVDFPDSSDPQKILTK